MPKELPLFKTLISAPDLVKLTAIGHTVIIDCRHDLTNPLAGQAAYNAGHISGARFASLDHDLSDQIPGADGVFRGRHPLPTRTAWISTLRSWGVDDSTQIIAYDAQGGMFAARLWWMMRWIGHAAVAVLDGGLGAWIDAGQPLVSAGESVIRTGGINDRPSLVTTVSATDVGARLDNRCDHSLIDARAPDRFKGENETLDLVGGHIPGAKNRFFKNNLQADGRFKSSAGLRAEFTQLIVDPARTILQCGSGVTACHHLLAMEIAGLQGASLYPGSWSEWCADPSRPVAIGDN